MSEPQHNETHRTDEGEELRVAPLPETFNAATSPAYRPSSPPEDTETYDLGPEVDASGFSAAARNWKEAAAGVQHPADEFGLAPELPTKAYITRMAFERALQQKTAQQGDRKIGTAEDPSRFTLRGLFVVLTVLSIVLAMGSRLPRPAFAGISGVAAFVTLILARTIRFGGAVFKVAWWILLGIYVLVSVFAMLQL